MIIDENLLAIQTQLDQLFTTVLQGTVYQRYQTTKAALKTDAALQVQIAAFKTLRNHYATIADYGTAAPGFMQVQREVLQAKRDLDLQPKVQAFKQAETDLENLWGQISLAIADSISPKIQVAAGNPFFATKRRPHQR